MKKSIGIIGAGKVGSALAIALKRKGHPIAAVCCRSEESAQRAAELIETDYSISPVDVSRRAELVFITTPDGFIEDVCSHVADSGGFREGQVVLHTSGAYSSQVLLKAKRSGTLILSMHPLQSFPSVETGLENMAGSYFTVEGDAEAVTVAGNLVSDLGGVMLSIPTEMKSLYHASACVVCNYFVTLVDLGLKMIEAAGFPKDKSLPALLPLIEGTLSNIKKVGVPAALTGPVDRGDASTVESHMSAMKDIMPGAVELYGLLGAFTARVAREKGTLSEEVAEKICRALQSTPLMPRSTQLNK